MIAIKKSEDFPWEQLLSCWHRTKGSDHISDERCLLSVLYIPDVHVCGGICVSMSTGKVLYVCVAWYVYEIRASL